MITGTKIRLRDKRMSDARDDHAWQSDPELAQLDAVPALTISYAQYLLNYSWELRLPSLTTRRFAVESLDGKHIGNCSYYNINTTKGEAELGIMIGERDYWDKSYGTDTVLALINHISQETKLKRLYLKTLESNTRAQKCFQKCGFTPYGHLVKDGCRFILMELYINRRQRPGEKEDSSPTETFTREG
jgi:RimJ/RimL family protein N-acetyltransferase